MSVAFCISMSAIMSPFMSPFFLFLPPPPELLAAKWIGQFSVRHGRLNVCAQESLGRIDLSLVTPTLTSVQ
ncbi:hypothetical protein BKA93DRAFT_786817 [Sparassis latifolia]